MVDYTYGYVLLESSKCRWNIKGQEQS